MDPLQIWVRNMDRKKEIRAKILKMRQALPKEEVREKSLRIMRRIEETETFKNADNLLAYIDFRGEVATRTLIEKAWELGKKVYVPRVAGKEMEFYQIHSFEDLEKGAYGILEPKKECPVYEAGYVARVLQRTLPPLLRLYPLPRCDRHPPCRLIPCPDSGRYGGDRYPGLAGHAPGK